jgi:hypothetical protein
MIQIESVIPVRSCSTFLCDERRCPGTPLVDYGSYQTDYVKSAHRVGVPVVFAPFSWDNLTNRGLIRVEPDRVLVWNDIQKKEATELHGVSPERVVVTGAPRFDEFFEMRPSHA